ncbi:MULTISPECIES: MFS transporter [Hydrocarboniphaga]|uniref:High affinity nitrate transporter transmembrane protein n=1 Tax=Hydrocarboniphaga effusa AP103 TaxID=1172194 RepID=I8I2R6_9GAMM|nr:MULTISPECIES: MFS transporter [Hydrocarboniphaga]EIT70044.1 high affinity nitrate transporter transmembrane protein [Hydrocarboniphaga effusa AP103]EIT70231.1 high affinity nitrate transporter transmembrane protein [Hydrocarboniphaga effusa AP103]MDZ4079986.1 MFS transporter [Hydrocarboniphaga sp.]
MTISNSPSKATSIKLFSFSTPQMRAFHMSWVAFFVCFFAWFAAAPLMPLIKNEFGLSKDQIANINIAAVAVTILIRLIVGPLCDRYGPRRTYVGLLILGAIPVFGVAASQSYGSFLFFRLLIGAIGASFVITQYHTSVMFAPNVVGTANAASAGWGNSGGGATQALMPLILTAIVLLGVEQALGWRLALLVPGVLMLITAWAYWKFTQDSPAGDFSTLRASGLIPDTGKKVARESFVRACKNYRVWMLFLTYGACFGVEIFIHNIVASYYVDSFGLSLKTAGLAAGSFGLLALFARALGGIVSDRIARAKGLDGRSVWLFVLIVGEGLGLLWFSHAQSVALAVIAMLSFGLCTHMACGATYALTPFIDRKALGGVAGIIGAGGNVGAVAAGFLMKASANTQDCLFILGIVVTLTSLCAIAVRFSQEHKTQEEELYQQAVRERSLAVG